MTAPDPTRTEWRRSSYSGSESNCVEVAWLPELAVRDSKNTTGPVLTFPLSAWRALLRSAP